MTTTRTIDVTEMSDAAFDALLDNAGEGFDRAVATARRVEAEEALAIAEAAVEDAYGRDFEDYRAALRMESVARGALEDARSAERRTMAPDEHLEALREDIRAARIAHLNTRSGQAMFRRTGIC